MFLLNTSGVSYYFVEFHEKDKFIYLGDIPENHAFTNMERGMYGRGFLFELEKKKMIADCNPENGFRNTSCIQKMIIQKMGCKVPWYESGNGFRICNTTEDFEKFTKLRLNIYRGNQNLKEFGCLPQKKDCQTRNWKRNVAFDMSLDSLKTNAVYLFGLKPETNFEDLIALSLMGASKDVRYSHIQSQKRIYDTLYFYVFTNFQIQAGNLFA